MTEWVRVCGRMCVRICARMGVRCLLYVSVYVCARAFCSFVPNLATAIGVFTAL